MGKTTDLFEKIGAMKGTFHGNMDTIKERNGNLVSLILVLIIW